VISDAKPCESGLDRLKIDARRILESALDAVDPYKAVHFHVTREGDFLNVGAHRYDLREVERVLVVGAGKASARMAVAIEEILGDLISDGLINVKYGHGQPLKKIAVQELRRFFWKAGRQFTRLTQCESTYLRLRAEGLHRLQPLPAWYPSFFQM